MIAQFLAYFARFGVILTIICFDLAYNESDNRLCGKVWICADLLPFCAANAEQRYALGNDNRPDINAQEDDAYSVQQPDGEEGVDIHSGIIQRTCKQDVESHSSELVWQRIIFASEKIRHCHHSEVADELPMPPPCIRRECRLPVRAGGLIQA